MSKTLGQVVDGLLIGLFIAGGICVALVALEFVRQWSALESMR